MATKIKQEIRILKQLRHPNVVELKEVLASRQHIFMVMELVPGGELFDKIVAEGPMSVSMLQPIPCRQSLAGMCMAFTAKTRSTQAGLMQPTFPRLV